MCVDKEQGRDTHKRVEFLGIEWHDCKFLILQDCHCYFHSSLSLGVHSSELNLTQDLDLVTLPGIKILRDIANEILIDIVIYMTPDFREV